MTSDVNKDMGPKAKDRGHKVKVKVFKYHCQGQGQYSGPKAKAKDLGHKANSKAKDLDFGLKDQGQGLRSLIMTNQSDFLQSCTL